ncbi:MAG: DNA-3-methyladenine glycosylase II [Parasphingorhabdus sp.]|jgi:DNA-3-methyladenine glycosylase II
MPIETLNKATLVTACDELAQNERRFANILDEFSHPPLWSRNTGFDTMALIILEQQVSLRSARAIYKRLHNLFNGVQAGKIADVNAEYLQKAGLTRQKSAYIHELAVAIITGSFSFRSVARLENDEARKLLTSLKGIGPWSADVYLLFALGRSDIWPPGDLALNKSVGEVYQMQKMPDNDTCVVMSKSWRPWRSAAARMFWHAYLCRRGRQDD